MDGHLKNNLNQFNNAVFEHLDYYGLFDYITDLNPDNVAAHWTGLVVLCYEMRYSVRMTALIICGETFNKVMAVNSKETLQ